MSSDRTEKESLGETILKIEDIARRDPGGRGLSRRAPRGALGPAAFELLSSRRVAIVTGFCVRAAGIGETDGPPGSLALGGALRILGKKTALVTDRYSLPLLKAGARRLGIPFRALELPNKQNETDAVLGRFVSAFNPTHVVALERPGSAPDGHRYSMRGEILDDVAPSADRLFVPQPGRTWVTLAVGDGGNELGMGSLRDALKDEVPQGSLIFCASPADHTLACGISNWGGYALAAALSLLSGALLLRTPEQERDLLSAVVEAGAVDGCTRQRTLSVDGLSWEEYARTLQEIYDCTSEALKARKKNPDAEADRGD
ncbi:MAG: DUF4392 domain-containing protein [Treponema sp.]|nr:DUF4392 domain-containing protein [Treponema sp.]